MKTLNTLIVSLSFGLAGCGVSIFADPATNPIIEDSVGTNVGTLATTANRRLVMIDKKNGKYCAEASPDSVASFASLIAATAKADVAGKGKGSLDLAKTILSTSGVITKRSQGLQFYRDGVFAYCQALSNGYISRAQYAIALQNLRISAMSLARAEINQSNWNSKPEVAVVEMSDLPAKPASQ